MKKKPIAEESHRELVQNLAKRTKTLDPWKEVTVYSMQERDIVGNKKVRENDVASDEFENTLSTRKSFLNNSSCTRQIIAIFDNSNI